MTANAVNMTGSATSSTPARFDFGVIGLGVTGRSVAAFLSGSGQDFCCVDTREGAAGIESTAAITTNADLNLFATAGAITTSQELFKTADNVLVDRLGYRVNPEGAFVDTNNQPLAIDSAPIYAGTPSTPSPALAATLSTAIAASAFALACASASLCSSSAAATSRPRQCSAIASVSVSLTGWVGFAWGMEK